MYQKYWRHDGSRAGLRRWLASQSLRSLWLVLALLSASVAPAAAAGQPGGKAAPPGAGQFTHPAAATPGWPSPQSRLPAQPAWPAGLWRPELAGQPGELPAGQPASTPAAPGSTWRIRHTPSPAVPNGFLTAGSCTSATACTAVGSYENRAGTEVLLAEAGHGTKWRIRALPGPAGARWAGLFGVSCTSANACIAVGWYYNSALHVRPLAERWNGRNWRIQAVPRPAGSLHTGFFAVSCASARACTATGASTRSGGATTALAERWNGSRWRIQRARNPAGSRASELLAVSCSSARACTAAGSYGTSSGRARPLAERWNGTRWRLQAMPSPAGSPGSGIAGISCPSRTSCAAAGSYNTKGGSIRMLAERWNGRAWHIQARPTPTGATGSVFLGVSCSSPGACTAVGSYLRKTGPARTLAERWNGSHWRVQASPNPASSTGAGFAGVSCPWRHACTAVGSYGTRAGPGRTLAAHWNGRSWHRQATPSPTGAAVFSSLSGVSCTSASACTGVGFSVYRNGANLALAERWNGKAWRIQAVPRPAGAVAAQLSGVSCTSARVCTGAGSYYTGRRDKTLAERWDGTRWRIQATPNPAVSRQSDLAAVSCLSARACVAVGWYENSAGHTVPLAETWDGTRWRLRAVPSPATNGQLSGVSCASLSSCTAVGSAGGAGNQTMLAEHWDGMSWQVQATASPAGFQGGSFTGVSCPSPHACTAVGSYFSTTGGPLTLAEHWNGVSWQVQATRNAAGAERDELSGVSCATASACTAVGYHAATDFAPPLPLAETWDGSGWRIQATPRPAGAISTVLSGVSCPAAGTCTATGYYIGMSGVQLTLAMTSY